MIIGAPKGLGVRGIVRGLDVLRAKPKGQSKKCCARASEENGPVANDDES
jgi:hypothetical protein